MAHGQSLLASVSQFAIKPLRDRPAAAAERLFGVCEGFRAEMKAIPACLSFRHSSGIGLLLGHGGAAAMVGHRSVRNHPRIALVIVGPATASRWAAALRVPREFNQAPGHPRHGVRSSLWLPPSGRRRTERGRRGGHPQASQWANLPLRPAPFPCGRSPPVPPAPAPPAH